MAVALRGRTASRQSSLQLAYGKGRHWRPALQAPADCPAAVSSGRRRRISAEAKIRASYLLLFGLIAGSAQAQPPDILFARGYAERGGFAAIAFDDTLNPPRHVVLAGTATVGGFQFYAVRADNEGRPEWTRLYGSQDRCETVIRSSGGYLFLLGYTTANPTVDHRLMRLLPTGQQNGNWTFGGNTSADYGRAILEHPDGWLCITGQATPSGSTVSDVPLIRVSTQGDVSWARTLSAGSSGEALTLAGDTLLFVFATSDSSDTLSGYDLMAFRTDSAGLASSSRRFAAPGEQVCRDALRLSDSLTIVVGATRPWGSGARYWDMLVVATNDSLDSLWSRTFGTGFNDMALSVSLAADRDSGVVIAGWSDVPGTGSHYGVLLKISRAGDSLWSMTQPGETMGEFTDVRQDSAYRYHVAGTVRSGFDYGLYLVTEPDPHSPGPHPPRQFSLTSPAEHDTIRADSIVFVWQAAADPDSADTVRYRLRLGPDTLFADTNSTLFGPLDSTRLVWPADTDDARFYWRVEALDLDGHVRVCRERQWDFLLSVPDSTPPFSLVFPDSGRMLPSPFSVFRWQRARDPDANDTVTYTLHFLAADSELTVPGLRDTFATANFTGNPLIHPGDTVGWFVTAASRVPPMIRESRERWTFITWVNSSDEPLQLPLEFALHSPFPNPFNASTSLRFVLDRTEDIRLEVFDVLGRRVGTLASGVHTPGAYSLLWNGEAETGALSSGVYFVRLTAGARQRTAKLMLLR